MKKKVLAIDPMSTYATYDGEVCNTYSLDKKKPYLSFYNNLISILGIGEGGRGFTDIVFESSFFQFPNSQKIMHYQRGVIIMLCELTGIKFHEISPNEVKKSFLGTAKKELSTKKHMIAEAERRGYKVKNDHEADAIAIYHAFKVKG